MTETLNLYNIEERRKFVALPANTKKSNRALAKEMGISEGTVRGDRKWIALLDKNPVGKANEPKKPLELSVKKPYDPSNVQRHRERMLAAAKLWLLQAGVVRADVEWIVSETSKQLFLKRIEFTNLGSPAQSPEFLIPVLRPIRKVDDYMPDK